MEREISGLYQRSEDFQTCDPDQGSGPSGDQIRRGNRNAVYFQPGYCQSNEPERRQGNDLLQ